MVRPIEGAQERESAVAAAEVEHHGRIAAEHGHPVERPGFRQALDGRSGPLRLRPDSPWNGNAMFVLDGLAAHSGPFARTYFVVNLYGIKSARLPG